MKLFDLYADLSLNSSKFNEGIGNAREAGAAFQDKTSKVTATAVALGHALYDVGVKAFEAAKDLGEAIIEGYSETEQLLGGVETMFEDHSGIVIANATAAYRKAGMSANDYMETVTGFSASLLQGLGGDTEAAANVADMAIQDMSDNANKFGTNIGMIQNAYQGFAKDNFTMLDNLKLGYGGTAAEMARLVNESGVLGESIEVTADTVKDVPLDKIFEAIHNIQVEMGITGTTAKEASTTISGSASAFAAAWQNVLSGLANKDADIGPLMDALFETGKTYVGNVIALFPTIAENAKEALAHVGEEVAAILADVYDQFVTAWDTELPGVITAGANSIISTINDIFGTNIPSIEAIEFPTWAEIVEAASAWWDGIRSGLETLARWTIGIFETPEATAEEMRAVFGAWWESTAKPAIEGAAAWVLSLFNTPAEGESEITALVNGWWATAGKYVENACTWALTLFGVPEETAEDIKNLVSTWWNGIASVVSDACKVIFSLAEGDTEAAKEAILAWWENVTTLIGNLLSIGFDIIAPLVSDIQAKLKAWWDDVLRGLGFVVEVGADVHTSTSGTEHGGAGRRGGDDLPSHATGLSWVPHDDYVARLHVGEAVLTRQEAAEWRNGGVSTGRIEALLSAILSALGNPVPAVIDGSSVYDYVSGRFSRDIRNKSFAL